MAQSEREWRFNTSGLDGVAHEMDPPPFSAASISHVGGYEAVMFHDLMILWPHDGSVAAEVYRRTKHLMLVSMA